MAAGCLAVSVVGVTLRSNASIAFRCACHVVSEVPTRSDRGRMEVRLKEIIAEVVTEKRAWLIEVQTMPDNVRLLLEVRAC
jgi:putative transposase